jgi:hypothetical protein
MQYKLIGLTLLIAVSVADTASAEILYPWCRQSADGSINCGFSSQQQCQDTAVGKGAFCVENPSYRGSGGASAKKGAGRR